MRVKVADITPSGMTVNGKLPLEPLNCRMDEGSGNEIIFVQEPVFEMRIVGTPQGAEVRGAITGRFKQPCSRCLRQIEQELKRDIDLVIKPISSIPKGLTPDHDANVLYFEGDHVDFEDALQETLILGLSPFLLPPRLPDGRCSVCKLDVPSELKTDGEGGEGKQKLGDLFRKAGLQ